MAINQYFNYYNAPNEQELYENMITEALQIYGLDVEYLPRTLRNYDDLYGSDTISTYNSHQPIEMYIKSVNGYEGDGTFLSKFGIEIRDQITLTVAIKRFKAEISSITGQDRPNEGDLIYIPLGDGQRVFFIKEVIHRSQFYPLGTLQVYDLVCETFSYASENLSTGIEYVDNLETTRSAAVDKTGPTEFDIPWDAWADNEELQEEAEETIDFDESNPFGDLST